MCRENWHRAFTKRTIAPALSNSSSLKNSVDGRPNRKTNASFPNVYRVEWTANILRKETAIKRLIEN